MNPIDNQRVLMGNATPQLIIPNVVETTNRGERGWDIYSRLLRERIIFLGAEIDSQIANVFIAQLLFLAYEDGEREIRVYINSPGGEVYAGLAMYDTMQMVNNDVSTFAMGFAASAASLILVAGTKGKRYALPNSRVLIHQGSTGFRGNTPDVEIQARESINLVARCIEILAAHSGQPYDKVKHDTERDYYLNAEEAKEYGLIDAVLEPQAGKVPSMALLPIR